MNRKDPFILVLLALFLSGCRLFSEPDREVETFTETYLPYKQPSRDAGYPKMLSLRAQKDGTYFEMQGMDTYGWGQRFTVKVTSSHNSYWNHTSRSVEYLSGVDELNESFRLFSISAPYFGADKRSFIDKKSFICASDEVCGRLDDLLGKNQRFDMVMSFGKTAEAPLVLDAVESPTCYTTMDCHARDECCSVGEKNVCVVFEECPADKRVDR